MYWRWHKFAETCLHLKKLSYIWNLWLLWCSLDYMFSLNCKRVKIIASTRAFLCRICGVSTTLYKRWACKLNHVWRVKITNLNSGLHVRELSHKPFSKVFVFVCPHENEAFSKVATFKGVFESRFRWKRLHPLIVYVSKSMKKSEKSMSFPTKMHTCGRSLIWAEHCPRFAASRVGDLRVEFFCTWSRLGLKM